MEKKTTLPWERFVVILITSPFVSYFTSIDRYPYMHTFVAQTFFVYQPMLGKFLYIYIVCIYTYIFGISREFVLRIVGWWNFLSNLTVFTRDNREIYTHIYSVYCKYIYIQRYHEGAPSIPWFVVLYIKQRNFYNNIDAFKENTLKVYTYIYIYIYMSYELGRKKKKEFFLPWINKKKFEIIIRLIWPNLEEIFFHSKEVAGFE